MNIFRYPRWSGPVCLFLVRIIPRPIRNISILLLSGRAIAGVFSPSNGTAQGTFSISTGGTQSYSLLRAVPARLANISTRGVVGAGEQVLIGGFIIVDGGKTVVIRALGPSLSQFNVTKSCPKYPIRPVPRSTIDCI